MRLTRLELVCTAVFWAVTLSVQACQPLPPPEPPGPAPEPQPGTCQGVCENLRALGCKGGEPTPAGASCEVVCENVQASGFLEWNLGCRAAAPTCPDVELCER